MQGVVRICHRTGLDSLRPSRFTIAACIQSSAESSGSTLPIAIGSSIAILLFVSNIYGVGAWLPSPVSEFAGRYLHQPAPLLDALSRRSTSSASPSSTRSSGSFWPVHSSRSPGKPRSEIETGERPMHPDGLTSENFAGSPALTPPPPRPARATS